MSDTTTARTFEVRHVQLARALFAAIATVMITFSSDHSAQVGLAVFSGFGIATGLVHFAAALLVYPAGRRWPSLLLGFLALVAGMMSGLGPLRTPEGFFWIVISWALLSGIVETVSGARGLRGTAARRMRPGHVAAWAPDALTVVAPRTESRDAFVIGIVTLVLAIALLCVPSGYALQYTIEEAHETFTLTGVTIGVGILGGYAAIAAVFLAIAGFSPRQPADTTTAAPAEQKDPA